MTRRRLSGNPEQLELFPRSWTVKLLRQCVSYEGAYLSTGHVHEYMTKVIRMEPGEKFEIIQSDGTVQAWMITSKSVVRAGLPRRPL